MPTAQEAVEAAEAQGEEVPVVTDAAGKELKQRPISISTTPVKSRRKKAPAKKQDGMVKVYNKTNSWVFTSTGRVGPEATTEVLQSDLDKYPLLAERLLKVA